MMDMETIQSALRKAMNDSGVTRYRISKETGLPESVLSRFAAGDDARGGTIDTLADFLGAELRVKAKKPKAAATKKGAR